MAILPDKEPQVAPGSTLRRYLDAAKYYKKHPDIDLDNPPAFMIDRGILPPDKVIPKVGSYQRLNDPEYGTGERNEVEQRRKDATTRIQETLESVSFGNLKKMLPRMDDMVYFLGVRTAYNQNLEDTNTETQTHAEKSNYELIRTGCEFYLIDVMRRLQTLYDGPNKSEVDEVYDFLKYYMGSGFLIPFGNNSFLDAFGKNERQISGIESLELLTLPLLLGYSGLDITYHPVHGNKYSSEYPSDSRFGIHDMILSVLYANDQISNKTFKMTPKSPNDRTLLQTVNRFVGDIARKKQIINYTLLNHQKPDHIQTVEIFNSMLGYHPDLLDPFVAICGIDYPADEIALYRRLVVCGESNDSPICLDTASKFEQTVASNPDLFLSLTLEEVKSFYEPMQAVGTQDQVSIKELKQIASDLRFEKKLPRQFNLDPLLVEDAGFSPPNILTFTFNMTDARIFSFRLGYKDSDDSADQIKYLNIDFNTNKGSFDWSILNNPDNDDPEISNLRQGIINLARKLLIEVKPLTKQPVNQPEYEPDILLPKEKREKYEDEVYKLRAEAKKGSPEKFTEAKSTTNSIKEPTVRKKPCIQFPDERIWADLTSNYSARNAEAIKKKIEAFNTSGGGDFKTIVAEELREDFDARLRVNVFKDTARVLLRLSLDENGRKYYKIVDIRRRGQAYK